MRELLIPVSALLEFHGVVAGHGYDVGRSTLPESRVADGGGGIGAATIVAVLVVVLVAVGALVRLHPSSAFARLKEAAPIGLVVVMVVAPLALWSATSRGDRSVLSVDRANALTGAPELLISLVDATLNTMATTDGKRTIRVRCRDRAGRVVLDVEQRWPFIDERGYEYPHAHQPATREQVLQADRCMVSGTRVRLQANVKGALARRALARGGSP